MLVIPAIDLIDGQCVRLRRGDYGERTSYAVSPIRQASNFQEVGFKRLHVVDLQGARSGVGENRRAIEAILSSVSLPVQIGGGIRTEADVRQLLGWGAAYLIVGTAALEEPERVRAWTERWGADRFIVSLDLRKGKLRARGWTEEHPLPLAEALHCVLQWGIPQIICTDVERDGTLDRPGYGNLKKLIRLLPKETALIAAGGVSRPSHLAELERIGIRGAVVGRALYEGEFSAREFARVG